MLLTYIGKMVVVLSFKKNLSKNVPSKNNKQASCVILEPEGAVY